MKDLTEPMHPNLEGAKETRKAASQAKKRIENFASNKGNNFFQSSPNEKGETAGDGERTGKTPRPNGKASPSLRELEHKKSTESF